MYAATLAFLLLTVPADAPPLTNIWPQWRGPTGDSVVPGGVLPTKWGKGENIVWKAPIPGWGNSTPAIWHDALFVTTQDRDRLVLLRLDRRTGKTVWEREVGRGTPRRSGPVGSGRYHDENNMASPSPVTDGKHVWAHFGTGALACYDFDGGRTWAVNLTERFGPFTIWWGHANSPCLAGDVLVCACIQDPKGGGKNYIVALDKATGKERWFAKRETGAKEEPADSYTTPILCRLGGREQVVVFGGNVLDAYDPVSGKRLWQCDAFKGNRVISGPTVAGDAVYAIQGMRGPLFAVRPEPGDAGAARVLWKYPGKTPDAASPAVANGLVFMATNDGVGICVDAATGKQVWKERLADAFRATPLIAGDRVYFFGKGGEAAIVQAARTFQVLARCDLGEGIVGSPAAAGGDLFIRTKGYLYRVGGGKAAGR